MNGYLVLGLVQYLNSEEGKALNSPLEISREIAIYRALIAHNGDIKGENFVGARRKLMGKICRPTDIHLVEQEARKLYAKGMLVMQGTTLQLDVKQVNDRIDELTQSIEEGHPSSRDLGEGLKSQIYELRDELKAMTPVRRLTRA